MKTYFVIYSEHDYSQGVRILGVYEDREKAKQAEEEEISNCGFFETVSMDEIDMPEEDC